MKMQKVNDCEMLETIISDMEKGKKVYFNITSGEEEEMITVKDLINLTDDEFDGYIVFNDSDLDGIYFDNRIEIVEKMGEELVKKFSFLNAFGSCDLEIWIK